MSRDSTHTEHSRRDFMRQFGIYMAATAATCCGSSAAFGQWPGEDEGSGGGDGGWPGRDGDTSGRSSRSGSGRSRLALQGCTLSANAANSFSLDDIRLLRSSGHHGVDQATHQEQRFLSGHIGNYRPSLAFMEDSEGNNAMALPRDLTGRGSPHGAVLLGVYLIRDLLNRPGARTEFSNAWSVAAVLAHEWAHIAQYANRVRTRNGRVVGMELMADAISGWYLAKKLQLLGQTMGPGYVQRIGAGDQTAAARTMYSMGDTNFTDPNHHGTHQQRLQAFVAGHNMGMQGGTFQHVFQFGLRQFI